MAEGTVARRLSAILAADVVGYSRMMAADEIGTLSRVRAARGKVVEPAIVENRGRIFKSIGDGLLAEFVSVTDAVTCAVAIQRTMAEFNKCGASEQIAFRIGVNLGDVIPEDGDLFGDGVNVAARLEALADPGGICVSLAVRDQVQDKIAVALDTLGLQAMKNMRPMQVFRVRLDGTVRAAPAPTRPVAPRKPAIAILPFANMSGDVEQDYFADGVTEDIITELSRFPNLLVIARNSSFTYKGRATKVQEVGRDLGVDYVVEGSMRKAGKRVRVTVQLVDAASGSHLWAERYDRELVDIFDLQDEITRSIVAILPGRLESAALERIKRKPPEDMAAYDFLLACKEHHHRVTKEDNAEAMRLVEKAIALDPEFAQAYAWKACTIGQAAGRGFAADPDALRKVGAVAIQRALSLDENDVECRRILCEIAMLQRDWGKAELHHARAFALNPNDPRLLTQRGELLFWMGRAADGVGWIEQAMRLDPYNAETRAHLLGRALMAAGRHEQALAAYRRLATPDTAQRADMAACLALLGRTTEARAEVVEILRAKPAFSIKEYVSALLFDDEANRAPWREGLAKAGLPQ
jgi:adenylate cyclase